MCDTNYTNGPIPATMSQAELFRRFLAAPVRDSAVATTLISLGQASNETMKDRLYGYLLWDTECFEDFDTRFFEMLDAHEDPADELFMVLSDLASVTAGVDMLLREFEALKESCLTEPPEYEEDGDAYHEWERNPRYILPVVAQASEVA